MYRAPTGFADTIGVFRRLVYVTALGKQRSRFRDGSLLGFARLGGCCGFGCARQYVRLDGGELLALQHVLERGHAARFARAAKHDSLKSMVRFGGGVAKVRNAGA